MSSQTWPYLLHFLVRLPPISKSHPSFGSTVGSLLSHVLARGGEVIVCKALNAPVGVGQWKAKRCMDLDMTITATDYGRGSIRLGLDGEDHGWYPATKAMFTLSAGMLVEAQAICLTSSEMLRQPRCSRIRTDETL